MTHTHVRTRRRNRAAASAIAVIGTCLTLGLTGCNGDNPEPSPTTTAAEPTPSPTPTKDPEGWKAKYTEPELKAYDAALQRWTEYETRAEQVWSKGKATPEAQTLFETYWTTWAPQFVKLQTYEENKITVSGIAEVLSSKASKIDLEGMRRVVIKQCIDNSPITTLVDGGPPEKVRDLKPYVRTITLDQAATTNLFMIVGVADETTLKKVTPCAS